MSIASRYNLHFHIWSLTSGIQKPSIGVSLVDGEPKNHEIASFLEANGANLTQHIIDEVHSLDLESLVDSYAIWGGNEDESVEIKSHPSRAVFNTGGKDIEMPIADFLTLLEEWKAYVRTIPDPHWLSNK